MASIDRRQGPAHTYTISRSVAPVPRWLLVALAVSWSCFPAAQDVQCLEDANCNRFTDGVCRSAASGNRWCSYPDAVCPSGYRYSDLDVGDEVSGACTEPPGQPRWVQQVGGSGWDLGNGVATDSDGNVIAVGTFSESLQLGATTLTSAGGYDVFVIKLNGITGDVIWARRFGGLGTESGSAVRTDTSKNIYVMGGFGEAVDFGGGELRSAGDRDVFVLKLTADGEHVWSRPFGGVGSDQGSDLAVHGDAIAIVGARSQSWAIDNSIRLHLGQFYGDIWIMTITTDGKFGWSKTLGGTSPDFARGVAFDSSGNVVVVGEFSGIVDFGGGPLMTADSSHDAFVAKYAGSSGAHLFSKRLGGPDSDWAYSVAVDSMDNIVIVGYFTGTIDLGGPASLIAISHGDVFVAKYTLAGAYLWAKSFGATSATSTGSEFARSVDINDIGDVVLVGQFCGTISFGGAEISSASECSMASDSFAVRFTGSSGGHVSSMRAGSRTEMTRMALTVDGGLFLVGQFDRFAQLGSHGLTPVNGDDAFILALAPL